MTLRNFITTLALLFGLPFALTAAPAAQQALPLPAALQRPWQQTQLKLDHASIVVQEAGSQTPLLSLHPDVPRNPASVMKLVTTWAGLSALGANWRWRTELLMDEDARIAADGTLSGPLYIRAGADPALTVENLWALLRDLRLRGVRHLNDVVADRSIFGEIATDPQAFDASGDRPYNASPDALMVNWGAVRIGFMADDKAKKWWPVLVPPVRGLSLSGHLAWMDGPCPAYPQYKVQLKEADGEPGRQRQLVLSGAVAGACGNFSVYRLAQSQTLHFETLFRTLWQELGGTWGAEKAGDTEAGTQPGMRQGTVPDGAQTLVWHDSPALIEVIRAINKYSNNVMARMLLLTLGVQAQGAGATVQVSAESALHLLREQGMDTEGWHIANGAGLSRTARLTAGSLAQMLALAWDSPLMPEFVSSLSIVGVDGTLADRLRTSSAKGTAHLKTGTLRDVQALAGYVRAASGKRYAVVSLVNHTQGADLTRFHDALIRWVGRQ